MTVRSFILSLAILALSTGPMAAGPARQTPLRTPDVIFVPTPQEVVDAMLKVAKVNANDIVYDLGSGDGRIPITAAVHYGVRATGIDIDPQRIKDATENLAGVNRVLARLDEAITLFETNKNVEELRAALTKQFGLTPFQAERVAELQLNRLTPQRRQALKGGLGDRVRFLNQDLFTSNISDATVVTLYLLPSLNLKLMPKLNKELKPGTRVVSHAFDMGDIKPDIEPVNVNGRTVYFFTVPID